MTLPIDQFGYLVRQGKCDEARECWHTHAELKNANSSGMAALICSIQFDQPDLMAEMIPQTQNFTNASFESILEQAASHLKADSLRRLLEMRPDAVRNMHDHRLLAVVYEADITHQEAVAQDGEAEAQALAHQQAVRQCMELLMNAGALHTLSEHGKTALDWVMIFAQTGCEKFLVNYGADLHGRGRDGRTLSEIYTSPAPAGVTPADHEQCRAQYRALVEHVGAKQQEAQDYLRASGHEKLLQAYADTPALRAAVHCTLSNNRGDLLLDAEYWRQNGGLHAATHFVDRLQAQMPDYLDYIHNRFDWTQLRRDEPMPRGGSVLVEYMRGGVDARKVGG